MVGSIPCPRHPCTLLERVAVAVEGVGGSARRRLRGASETATKRIHVHKVERSRVGERIGFDTVRCATARHEAMRANVLIARLPLSFFFFTQRAEECCRHRRHTRAHEQLYVKQSFFILSPWTGHTTLVHKHRFVFECACVWWVGSGEWGKGGQERKVARVCV